MTVLKFVLPISFLWAISEAYLMDSRTPIKTLTVDNGGAWGYWRGSRYCPLGSFAVGYKLKIEADQFTGDDTALNTVMLRCGDLKGNHYVTEIESDEGGWGSWQDLVMCNTYLNGSHPHDFIVGFQLQVEQDQNSGDDTAANYFKARCRDLVSGPEYEIVGKLDSGLWGQFGTWSQSCPLNSAVCGIEAKLEPSQGDGDDTSLNDIRLYCCRV